MSTAVIASVTAFKSQPLSNWDLESAIDLPWLSDARGVSEAPELRLREMDGIEWLQVGPLFSANPNAPRAEQARELWTRAADILGEQGFEFTDVLRTWLYVDDILGWYDSFNAVRDAFFREVGVNVDRLPASTAVGVDTRGRGAFVLQVLAARARDGALLRVRPADSPMQGAAANYGSSFSRALAIQTEQRRIFLVSGTASIDRNGATTHAGQWSEQVRETERVVEALLHANGFGCGDVCRALRYRRDGEDESEVPAWFGEPVHAQVCRRNLRFEVEVDAVQLLANPDASPSLEGGI